MAGGRGRFYAVSVGPGNPELLTLEAVRCLEKTKVLAVPVNAGGSRKAYQIAQGALDLSGKEILELKTAMIKDKEKLKIHHDGQAMQVKAYLDRGEDVAMLTLGDVSVYSTAMYLLERLVKAGYEGRMLAGVPSFCAIAAELGISLTEMDQPLHIIPASYGDSRKALRLRGTKVFMKSGKRLGTLLEEIKEAGLAEQSLLMADCGMESQLICRDIRELEKLPGYFTTVIVKEKEK